MARQYVGVVKVKGAAALMRKLRRMPDDIAEGVKAELRVAAAELVGEMQTRVPVSETPKQGREHLRDQIRATFSIKGLRARVGVQPASSTGEYFYARYLEFGTKKMDAKPFVLPSWILLRPAIQGGIKNAVKNAFQRVASQRFADD